MLNEILGALYFFLPAYVANMMPAIIARARLFKFLDSPIDLGLKLGKKDIFGRNKTFRGFIVGIIAALLIGLLQYVFVNEMSYFATIDYTSLPLVLGVSFLLGFGALVGDCVESFIKRRIGKRPSEPWPVADQVDYVLGALLFVLALVQPSLVVVLTIIIFSPIATISVNIFAYLFGIKNVWW